MSLGFTLQIHSLSFFDYVYIITGIQLFVKGLKESFLNITKNITLEGIEPSLFYSTTTKPPGAGQSPAKGIEPFLYTLSKLTLQKLSLILYCNYSITGIQSYVNGVILLFLSLYHLCNTQHT